MKQALTGFYMLLVLTAYGQEASQTTWTDTSYPDYITKVTDFGERADWSHDGMKILFVERSFGDVYEYNLITGKYKPLTHHYYHGGYARASISATGISCSPDPRIFQVMTGRKHASGYRSFGSWIRTWTNPPHGWGNTAGKGPPPRERSSGSHGHSITASILKRYVITPYGWAIWIIPTASPGSPTSAWSLITVPNL